MKIALIIATTALLLVGCCSYSEIAPWNSPDTINDGEVPKASFVTANVSYQLFGALPICTGRPWTSGNGNRMDDFRIRFFADEASLDTNLLSLQHALNNVGSHRITQLSAIEDDDWVWSLFVIRRHKVLTKCIILEEK